MEAAMIFHDGLRPDYWKDMVKDCSYNIRLSKSEETLLTYYCDRTNYFQPSLKLIERSTGISSKKVSLIRRKLVDKGLITYGFGRIIIHWFTIRSFAMMPRLSKKESLHGSFKKRNPSLKLKNMRLWERDAIKWGLMKENVDKEYTEQEKAWISTIENMTPVEYSKTLDFIRKWPDSQKTKIVSGMCMYPKNEKNNVRVQRRTFDVRELFEAHGYHLTDEELAEFDWRDLGQLEEAVQFSSLDKIRKFLFDEDYDDFIMGAL